MVCRVFTTLEQLALSEEKEADVAAALAATAAAERAAILSQAAQAEQQGQLTAQQVGSSPKSNLSIICMP